MSRPSPLAAIDLGSNSFRLEIGDFEHGHIRVLDSLREHVRLAAGLDADKRLDLASQERGLEALARFAQRLQGFDPAHVRAVATNTLRVARNAPAFIARAEQVLGFPVAVIAGREEARLIFSGVAHALASPGHDDPVVDCPPAAGKRLVVDIGGGSTEFCVGRGLEPELMESLYMGSIQYSISHFPDGYIDEFTIKQAELSARRELQVIAGQIARSGWTTAVASSGTARTISRVLRENGIGAGGIDRQGMRWLRKQLLSAGRIDALDLRGLKPERTLNLPGGFAILSAVFAELGIERVEVADNALRLGVLYDLLARLDEPSGIADERENTVAQFVQRYHVERDQAQRVTTLATRLASGLRGALGGAYGETLRFLEWAARLHETGRTITHNGYHKHSAYIVANADMPGFSRDEQKRLAFLILGHNGKLPKLTREPVPEPVWLAVACLRLAAVFHRARQASELPELSLERTRRSLRLRVNEDWLRANPLTEYSLQQEIKLWQALGDARPFVFALEAIGVVPA